MNFHFLILLSCGLTTKPALQRGSSIRSSLKKAFNRIMRPSSHNSTSSQDENIYEKLHLKVDHVNFDLNHRSLPGTPLKRQSSPQFDIEIANRSSSCPGYITHRKRCTSDVESKCFHFKFIHNLFGPREFYKESLQNSETGYVIMHGSTSTLKSIDSDMQNMIEETYNKYKIIHEETCSLDDSDKNSILLDFLDKLSLDKTVVMFEYAFERDLGYVITKFEEFKKQIEEAELWHKNECNCSLCKEIFY